MGIYRILCLDGGGIRGVYTAQLLICLQEKVPDLLKHIDLYAGTSTGGLLALELASNQSPTQAPYQAKSLYVDDGHIIFYRSFWRKLKTMWGLVGAKYDNKNLKACVQKTFHQKTFADLAANDKRVVITTFKLDGILDGHRTWKPVLMHNFPQDSTFENLSLVDACMRTSAAPTYFPTYQGYVDGGATANNPSMAALSQAIHEERGQRDIQEIRLFSLSTGLVEQYKTGERHNWGYVQWIRPLLDILTDGAMELVDEECKRFLKPKQYHRLAPALPESIALDDYKAIPKLIEYAKAVDISETVAWLCENFVDCDA